MENTNTNSPGETLRHKVEQAVGLSVQSCYQCGKCTAGCPLNEEMDLMPHQVLRLLQSEQSGYEHKILSSYGIWLCLTCETCYSRCPQEVHLPQIMDFLRQESLRQQLVNPRAQSILKFHQAFLAEVARNGKLNELGLTIDYKLRTGRLIQDVANAPSMLLKGKLNLLPHRVKNPGEIRNLFKKIIG